MARYHVAPRARADLDSIRAYLDTQSEEAWPAVRRALVAAFRLISSAPGVGHSRDDLTKRPFLFFSLRPYRYMIVYDPRQSPVAIARVFHGAQNISAALRHK